MLTLITLTAMAVEIPVQGSLTDAGGAPLNGALPVGFELLGTGGASLWSDTVDVAFQGGAFALLLSDSVENPMDPAWLANPALAVRVTLGGASSDPVAVGWAPRAMYAQTAGVAGTLSAPLAANLVPSGVAWTNAPQTFQQSVTAQSFIGSGAGLTDVPTAAITGATLTLTGTPSAAGHAVTKGFLDSTLSGYLARSGGTMTGDLTLAGAPTSGLHAATKAYVDTAASGRLPVTGGTIAGALTVNGLLTANNSGGATHFSAGNFNVATNGVTQVASSTAVFGGTFTAWANHPACDQGTWYINLGDTNANRGYLDIELFGDHRSGSSCGAASYDRWVLSTGDMGVRGTRLNTSGYANIKLNIQTAGNAAPYVASSPTGAANLIRLDVPAYDCGCDRVYQYTVRYHPGTFTPRADRNPYH